MLHFIRPSESADRVAGKHLEILPYYFSIWYGVRLNQTIVNVGDMHAADEPRLRQDFVGHPRPPLLQLVDRREQVIGDKPVHQDLLVQPKDISNSHRPSPLRRRTR